MFFGPLKPRMSDSSEPRFLYLPVDDSLYRPGLFVLLGELDMEWFA